MPFAPRYLVRDLLPANELRLLLNRPDLIDLHPRSSLKNPDPTSNLLLQLHRRLPGNPGVSKIDLLGEPSSDSSGSLSTSSDDREEVNNLLPPGQYIALPATRVKRD